MKIWGVIFWFITQLCPQMVTEYFFLNRSSSPGDFEDEKSFPLQKTTTLPASSRHGGGGGGGGFFRVFFGVRLGQVAVFFALE